jgi:hydroxypyruvate isomerase
MPKSISRRSLLKTVAAGSALAAVSSSMETRLAAAEAPLDGATKGRINHSVCKWCYPKIDLNDLCKEGKKFGLKSIELLGPKDWPTLKEHGLTCSMANGAEISLTKGWNRPEAHEQLLKNYEDMIPKVAAAGLTNLICFSGNRGGLSDEDGIKNCVAGLKKLMPTAEKHQVNVVMELLNSKVDHKDYQCDHTAWGVEVCKGIGSERFKLLYDIYHMQIMEGDVIATIKKFHPYIAHYHTGGVPGRNEIDETQELNYPAIMRAIVETGYKGFVAQEFIPKRSDAIASLKQGVAICDV